MSKLVKRMKASLNSEGFPTDLKEEEEEEAATLIESQQAEIERLRIAGQAVVDAYLAKPFCDAASPLELEQVLALAEALEQANDT